MVLSTKPPANGFVASARNVYNPIGFGKGYNFVLFFIFAGAMMGFALSRLMFLDFDGIYCSVADPSKAQASPGECWSYKQHPQYLIGIKMHLFTVIPASFLVCFQFVPVIRHKLILAHRMNGYLIILLAIFGTVGALMIARVAFGGGIAIQFATGMLAIVFILSLAISMYNVKMLQLEQHRAWMLRAWFYAGCIITVRLVMIASAMIISTSGAYYKAMPCAKIATFYRNSTLLEQDYPACKDVNAHAAVKADMNAEGAEGIAAALEISFGMAMWLAFAIHAIGIEIYLHLTPAEAERLRNVSYQRQLEAGSKNPGRAGLTADRIGDSPKWIPESQRNLNTKVSSRGGEADTS